MRAAIYCRLSEEDRNKANSDDDSNSIQNQKAMLVQYARTQEWTLYDIYSDDDYAGADRNRPQFKRLLADAEARKFDIILCKTQSRFTRELELVEKYIHGLFPLWGIRFVSIVDNADTANKGNKKSRQINGLVNEWYLEDLSENIRSVLTSRRQNGYHIGSFAPYGYQKDPERKGHLIIDEEAAAIVREIFTKFAQGCGKTAIARSLNDRGIPNPTEYKRRHGFRYRVSQAKYSTYWKYRTICDILSNEVYIGNLVQGKYESVSYKTKQLRPRRKDSWIIVSNTHEPIIDRELWDRVQGVSKSLAKARSNGQVHPLARKVRCAHCGYVLKTHQRQGRYYLQCTHHMIARDACPGAFIPLKELEQIILAQLNKLTQELLDRDEVAAHIDFADSIDAQIRRTEAERQAYARKLEEFSNACRQLYLDRVKGIIPEEEYKAMSHDFLSEKKHCEALLIGCTQTIVSLEQRKQLGDNRLELVGHYIDSEQLTREMVLALIDYVTVSRRNKDTKQVPVEIHWNF